MGVGRMRNPSHAQAGLASCPTIHDEGRRPAMNKSASELVPPALVLQKLPTGIEGFDQITGGGLPRGRMTLVMGGPGCGKTIFALQTLVNGARQWGERGIFVTFEENPRQHPSDAVASRPPAVGLVSAS